MTTWEILSTVIIFILICIAWALEGKLSYTRTKANDWKSDAEKFEKKWHESEGKYFECKEEHLREMMQFKESYLSKEESLQIKNDNEILNERYNKLTKENEHLKAELDSADYMLERYRQYFRDAKKLGYKCKTSSKELSGRTPISYPDFIKEENPDG